MLIRCCGEREDGGQWFASDNALPLSVLPGNHWPSPRKLLSTDSIKSDKSVSVLPGNPLLALFVPDFDFRPYSGWCGLPYSAALGFLLGLGSSLTTGQIWIPAVLIIIVTRNGHQHQCTQLEQPFEMRALEKRLRRAYPPLLKVRAHELIWVGFHLISKGTKSIRYCKLKGAETLHSLIVR